MKTFIIIYALVLVVSFLTMTFLLVKAPLGYEDENGFHEVNK